MADSSNQPRPDQHQLQQPLLTSQLIALNSSTGVFQPTVLPVARPGTPVIIRPPGNNVSPARNLVVIRPTSLSNAITPPAQRIVVQQQTAVRPLVTSTVTPTLIPPPSMEMDNQPDASNAPVATLLRNAPIPMRFFGFPKSESTSSVTTRLPTMNRILKSMGSGAVGASKLKPRSATENSPQSPQRKVIREMQVRVCPRPDRKFSVMRYNAYDRVDLSGGDTKGSTSIPQEVFLQRENNLRQFKSTHNTLDTPTSGAGSEYGQDTKEEARLRRLGIMRQSYRVEDQPWLLTVGKGRTAKRYKGIREGNVSANVRHFIFCQTKDGNFDAYPVHEWYKLNPEVNYRFLRDDEAEAEFSRRHKTMNLFNVMVKRKMADESLDEIVMTTKETVSRMRGNVALTTKRDKSVKRNRSSALLLTELDEWKDFGPDDEEDETNDGVEGEAEPEEVAEGGDGALKRESTESGAKKTSNKKRRAAAIVARKRRATKQRARRRRKGAIGHSSDEEEDDVNEEAWDESDPDDHEGDEVDYITDSSSDEEKLSEDDREQIYQVQGVDEEAGLKALLTDISDSDDDAQNKPEDSNIDDFDEEEGADGEGSKPSQDGDDSKTRSSESKARRTARANSDFSSNDESDEESSDESSSESSTSSGSDSDTAPDDPIRLDRKAQKRVELLQRISERVASQVESQPAPIGIKRPGDDFANAAKRPKMAEPASDDALTAAVRKYLTRKPITVTDLLKKIRSKRLVPHASLPSRGPGGSGTDDVAETMLANALRQLRPIKHIVNGQPLLSLKR